MNYVQVQKKRLLKSKRSKNVALLRDDFYLIDSSAPRLVEKRLATTCSPTVLTAVPSAREVLTTEFGMGSGVALPL